MYVAITRARKRLYLSYSQTRMLHGQTRYNVKSRFFDELPEAALKWLTPKNQSFGRIRAGYGRAWESGSGLRSIVGSGRASRATTSRPSSRRRRRTAFGPGRACSTPSSAKGCSRSKAAATMLGRKSTSAATA